MLIFTQNEIPYTHGETGVFRSFNTEFLKEFHKKLKKMLIFIQPIFVHKNKKYLFYFILAKNFIKIKSIARSCVPVPRPTDGPWRALRALGP